MSQSTDQDRRIFDRIPLHKEIQVTLAQQGDQPFRTVMNDVSLKGLLIDVPEDLTLKPAESVLITIQLSGEDHIQLKGRVVHVEADESGIKWTEMDGDSFGHFRRMIELNLGDPEEIKREIPQLSSDDAPDPGDDEQPDKHMHGEGHAHHQFNPERAAEFHDEERLDRLKPKQLLEKLDVEADDHILDLGTGSGALLADCSARVSEGVVIGADISGPMLDQARTEVEQASLHNVVLTKNTPRELPLITDTQDAVLIVSSLHEFSDPVAMLAEVGRVLKPGGRLGIVEWRHGETEEGPPKDHRLAPETIENWLTEAGLTLLNREEWTATGYDLYLAVVG